jgi:Protein of unknown function (DUF3307)
MIGAVVLLLVGLELKHFVADYTLQGPAILAGKGDLRAPGGYLHAAIHSAGSAVVLLVAAVKLPVLLALIAAEFVIHYGLDYAKIHYSRNVHAATQPSRFWALHGFDQLTHHLTYAGMIYIGLTAGWA